MPAVPTTKETDDAQPRSNATHWRAVQADVDSAKELPPVPAGHLVAERYALDRVLASGGMGVVWLARHVELEQLVAIKFLRPELAGNEGLVARFLEEARAAAALRGEHVVRVMDVGQLPEGAPYFVMEYLEGIDLETLLQQEGPLSPDRAIGYVLQACEALKEAHGSGIVHRDVKPENLFLVQGSSHKSIIKVVDFGIAKRLDSSRARVVTGPQENMGSPCYMSPEQMAAPSSIDARTDIWSLGVVLYQLLTGELPFDGDSVVEVFARVVNAPVRPLFELRPELDVHLDAIVRCCLEKEPSARFPSITDLSTTLRAYRAAALSRTPPSVAPIPTLEVVPHSVVTRSEAPVALSRHAPARTRGVGVAAALAVWLVIFTSAGAYAKLHGGAARLRRFTDGWLTAAALDVDIPVVPIVATAPSYSVEPFGEIPSEFSDVSYVTAEPEHGVADSSDEPDADSADAQSETTAATPRPDTKPSALHKSSDVAAPKTDVTPPVVDARIIAARRERSYRAYLSRHGWRPLKDVLLEMRSRDGAGSDAQADPHEAGGTGAQVPGVADRPSPSSRDVTPSGAAPTGDAPAL